MRAPHCIAVLVVALVLPASAPAAFPGENGRIVASYVRYGEADCADGHRVCETTTHRLMSVRPDGNGRAWLGAGSDAAWSPGGRRLVFNRGASIWVSSGRGARRIAGAEGYTAVWTPDGRHLVYGGVDGALYRIALGGTKPVRLTSRPSLNGRGSDHSPTVCRDGTIAFLRSRERDHLYLLRPGQRARRLTAGGAGPPDCSPGGTRLLYSSGGHTVICSIRGSQRRELLAYATFEPRWSPDGRAVAYSDGHDLFRVGLHGGPVRQITGGEHRGDFRAPAWRPLRGPRSR